MPGQTNAMGRWELWHPDDGDDGWRPSVHGQGKIDGETVEGILCLSRGLLARRGKAKRLPGPMLVVNAYDAQWEPTK